MVPSSAKKQQLLHFVNKDIHKSITLGCLLPAAALSSVLIFSLEIQQESKGDGRALLWSSALLGLLPSSSAYVPFPACSVPLPALSGAFPSSNPL